MKKYLFLAVAATAMMASCSNDEVVEMAQGEAIAFDNAFIDKSTRSIDPSITTKTLGEFKVYGCVDDGADAYGATNIFAGLAVISTDEGKTWSYDNNYIQYWQAGKIYDFAALGQAEGTITTDANGMPSTVAYTLADANQKDLIHAFVENRTGQATGNAVVEFNFQHQLSKVKFAVINGFPANSDTKIKVTNIKITNADKTNTLSLSTSGNTWGKASDTQELTFGAIVADAAEGEIQTETAVAIEPNEKLYSYYEKLIIPANKEFIITFDVEVIQGEVSSKFSHTADKGAIKATIPFELGKSYILSATLNANNVNPDAELKPIVFSATVAGWGEDVEYVNPADVTPGE